MPGRTGSMRTRSIHKAALTDAVTPLEESGKKLAYKAAVEGIVLLENDGSLPLKAGKIALYGAGAKKTIKGGTGSGEVNERHAVSVFEGLEQSGFTVTTMRWIEDYDQAFEEGEQEYAEEFRKKLSLKNLSDFMNLMSSPYRYPYGRAIQEKDIEESDTDSCIYVVSRQAGEGADRKLDENEYGLSEIERINIAFCAERYKKLIVVINVGGVFDLNFLNEISGINAVIFMGELGTMGGLALADVISGKQTPSGKLTDTWAKHYRDLPFADEYSYLNGNLDEEYYREGIYVGYRYFDTFHVAPRYPFGYGMSYTNFAIRFEQMQMEGTKIHVYTEVENTGRIYDGKEVVQIYVSCPNGELKKEAQRLTAFHKTKLLKPGEKAKLILSFDLRDMTSYRKKDAATVLEKGEYVIRLGNSSRNTRVCGILRLSSEIITEKHSHICKIPMHVTELKQKEEDILHAACDCRQNWGRGCEIIIENMEKIRSIPVEEDKITEIVHEYGPVKIYSSEETDAVMERLTLRDMAELSVGGGMTGSRFFEAPGAAGVTCTTLEQKGIPNVVMADGPAGLRLNKVSSVSFTGKVKGIEPNISCMKYLPEPVKKIMLGNPDSPNLLYQFTTAFPSGISLASSWNLELAEEVGNAVGKEMECYGVTYWLAPGLNIHRNPLCGRNFEYYSEDPLVSGKFAAAITKGVQKNRGCYVTLKHFCCNNQEDNRNKTNVNVNERALREIYLKGFEIAVKEAGPGAVMSSYNKVNGKYVNNSYRLLTQVLRNEWGFDGLVMTDWFATGRKYGNPAHAIASGNDLIMPGSAGAVDEIVKAVSKGVILEEDVKRSAANVLRGVLSSRIYQGFTRMYMKK